MFKQTTQAIAEFESVKQNKADSESATDTFLEDLGPNCDWVDKYFDSRMEKRKVEMDGLQEAMLMSTTAEIMPITQIDGFIIGDGVPGPVTRKLQKAFRQMVQQDQAIKSSEVS